MKKKRWLLLIAMLIAVMMLPLTANAAVKLNKKKVTLTVGKTVQLKVKGTKAKVNWSSTNKNVAVVNKKGKVSAKSVGSATIKAKVGKKTFKCKVTVNAPVTPAPAPAPAPTPTPAPEPSLSATKLDLIAGQQKQLTLNNASDNVTWSSSNFKVADVASDGTVYARFYGTCVVKATCGRKSYTCKVSVTLPNPECYPKTKYTLSNGNELRIDAFEAQFISYQFDKNAALTYFSGGGWDYTTCTYRIHIKGNIPYKSTACSIGLLSFWDRHMNVDDAMFGRYIDVKSDENGNFDTMQEVKFSNPVDMFYISDFYSN